VRFPSHPRRERATLFDSDARSPQLFKMNVTLSPESEQYIREKVATGDYPSPGLVIDEGLRLLQEQEKWKQDARRKIAEGLADIREGRIVSSDEAEQNLARRKAEWKARRAA
jgi:antitoxin ParD1/3/4